MKEQIETQMNVRNLIKETLFSAEEQIYNKGT